MITVKTKNTGRVGYVVRTWTGKEERGYSLVVFPRDTPTRRGHRAVEEVVRSDKLKVVDDGIF